MQPSKIAITGQPIKVFNNGNMPAPVKYEVYFTGPVPLVPWTYFSPLGWNAKQIPPGLSRGHVSVHWGVRDFTYVDDIVEGVVRVIDNPPATGPFKAGVPEGGTTEGTPPTQHNAISKGADNVAAQIPTEKETHNTSTDKLEARSSQLVAPYKAYNIGNSSPIPLMEYSAAIETTLGKTAQKEFLPMQPGDVPRTEADVTDLMEDLNYKPNTPVQAGIEKFIEWYRLYFGIK